MRAVYFQRGEALGYTPTEDTKAGQVVALGTRIGVATSDIPANELGNVHVVGVFSMTKAEGEELAQGAAVYYDSTAEAITATADGNTPAGYAASPAAATAATVMVKLLG